MPDRTFTPLRPAALSGYTDTLALNDIHALLSAQVPGDVTFGDVAQFLARSGRPAVVIRHELAGPGLLIEIAATTPAERDALTVTLDGATLHPGRAHGTA